MQKFPVDLADAEYGIKVYDAFRGCDFSTDPAKIADSRSPDCLNMVADDAGFPEKRIGWRTLAEYQGVVNGMFYAHLNGLNGAIIVIHHGTKLTAYNIATGVSTQIELAMNNAPSAGFVHGGKLYILDGQNFTCVAYNNGYSVTNVVSNAKTPTTGRFGHYEAEDNKGTITYTWVPCTAYEEPNLLSSTQINTLAGDGTNTVFWLTEKKATVTKVELYANGEWGVIGGYSTADDTTVGKTKITFSTPPAAHPDGAGIDNLRVTFTSTEHPADPTQITHCNIATQYGYFNDNRFFVSGNPDAKHKDWACGVDDPTYWPLNQWTQVGSDQTAIMGYLHYGDVLAIVKEDDNQDAEIYIRSAVVQSDSSVIFPVQQGVKGVGAISRFAFSSLRDDPLFYAREGVFAISGTDASQQRTVQPRSFFVDNRLRNEPGKTNAVGCVWRNLYLLAFPDTGHCYVADSRMQQAYNESFIYEWFYWDNIPACRFLEFDGNLFFGTTDGRLCRFNNDFTTLMKYSDGLTAVASPEGSSERDLWENGVAIPARWTTKADNFGTLSRLKTLPKHGSSILARPYAKGNHTILFSTEAVHREVMGEITMNSWDFGELDFANINFNSLQSPTVAPLKKKVKRFQTIQLIVENTNNEEPFGLYGIQLQYQVTRYAK